MRYVVHCKIHANVQMEVRIQLNEWKSMLIKDKTKLPGREGEV